MLLLLGYVGLSLSNEDQRTATSSQCGSVDSQDGRSVVRAHLFVRGENCTFGSRICEVWDSRDTGVYELTLCASWVSEHLFPARMLPAADTQRSTLSFIVRTVYE